MNTLKNTVSLIGRLGMDPEVTKFESGSMLARFSLATTDGYKDKNGEWVNNTEWHHVVAWGKSAELVKERLQKGMEVALEGKLENDSYTTKEGEKRTKTQIKMREFIIINRIKDKATEKAA